MKSFFRYQLRTTDVAAARAFYARVLGYDDVSVVPLHEQALARGARPHWLGFIDVGAETVEMASGTFVARGAQPLGPKWVDPQGLEAAVLRDPGGAVVALAKPPAQPANGAPHDVVWHLLNTRDVELAKTNYAEQCGWHFLAPRKVPEGILHPFAWQDGGPEVGAFFDIASRSGVHAHWLFHFRVRSLAAALEAVKSGGGVALGPFTLPNGASMAVCDDAQAAAFALLEAPAST